MNNSPVGQRQCATTCFCDNVALVFIHELKRRAVLQQPLEYKRRQQLTKGFIHVCRHPTKILGFRGPCVKSIDWGHRITCNSRRSRSAFFHPSSRVFCCTGERFTRCFAAFTKQEVPPSYDLWVTAFAVLPGCL